MPRWETVHECQGQLQQLVPNLSRPLHKRPAAGVCGAVWSGSCTLNRIAASLPTPARLPSTERRFRRFQLGRRWVARLLARDHPLDPTCQLYPRAAPALKLS